ncbi:FAD:protein FMN transferase, partial [Yersinia pestis]
MRKYITRCLMLVIGGLLLSGCGPEQVSLEGKTMGTSYSIKYVSDSSTAAPETLQQEIDLILEEVNDQMSTYRPHSELSRFNQSREV